MFKETKAKRSMRINVTLPNELLKELRELIPPRQRNQLIVDLLERELRHRRFLKAWDEAAGAWPVEDYPHLETGEDIDRWVRNLREQSMSRFDDLCRITIREKITFDG